MKTTKTAENLLRSQQAEIINLERTLQYSRSSSGENVYPRARAVSQEYQAHGEYDCKTSNAEQQIPCSMNLSQDRDGNGWQ